MNLPSFGVQLGLWGVWVKTEGLGFMGSGFKILGLVWSIRLIDSLLCWVTECHSALKVKQASREMLYCWIKVNCTPYQESSIPNQRY